MHHTAAQPRKSRSQRREPKGARGTARPATHRGKVPDTGPARQGGGNRPPGTGYSAATSSAS
jgi:hypothetical protein